MKKLLKIAAVCFGIFALAAIAIPLFFDVDTYRPLLIEKINERISGKIEIGKLRMSLWGRVKINIEHVQLMDAASKSVIAVKDVAAVMPFHSLLTGSPSLTLELINPTIHFVKDSEGKLNISKIMKRSNAPNQSSHTPSVNTHARASKSSATAQPVDPKTQPVADAPAVATQKSEAPAAVSASSTTAAPSADSKAGAAIPALLLNAHYTLVVENAAVDFFDSKSKASYKIDKLDLRIADVSPTSKMPFELTARLNLALKEKIRVTGPLVFKGTLLAKSDKGEFSGVDADLIIKLDGAEISNPGIFEKAVGVPLNAEMTASTSKNSIEGKKSSFASPM